MLFREEMGLKYLACTVRASNPQFAESILEHWYEYKAGRTRAAILMRQMDVLECIDQAIIYKERCGLDMGRFIALTEQVTSPELKPWLMIRLRDYQELQLRNKASIEVVCLSGKDSPGPVISDETDRLSGGPGVGNGTQCGRIAKEFDFRHICVDDLLLEEAKSPTSPYKDFIPESISESVLLPAQLTTMLLKREMERAQADGATRFLIDGFPRSVVQAADFRLKVQGY